MYFYVTLTTYYVYLKPVKSKRILMWINVLSTSYCHECNLLLSMVCADQRRLCEQIALILLRILKGVSSDFPPASCLKKCTIYIYIFFWIIKFFFLDEINLQLRFHVFVCFNCYQYISVSLLLPSTLSIHNWNICNFFYIHFSDIEDEIASLKEFSTELIVSSAVQCIKTILKQDVDLPNTLPGGMSARFRMGTGLANYIQVIRFCLEL